MVLCCVVLCCIVSCCIALHVLYCVVFIVLGCIVSCCIVLFTYRSGLLLRFLRIQYLGWTLRPNLPSTGKILTSTRILLRARLVWQVLYISLTTGSTLSGYYTASIPPNLSGGTNFTILEIDPVPRQAGVRHKPRPNHMPTYP